MRAGRGQRIDVKTALGRPFDCQRLIAGYNFAAAGAIVAGVTIRLVGPFTRLVPAVIDFAKGET